MNMQASLTVDVVIPAFNVERYIAACLESLKSEKNEIGRIHVVNNGSTDSTIQVVEHWSAANPEMPIAIHTEAIQSACAARNRGLKECISDWVKFLDADDAVESGSFARAMKVASRGACDVLYGDFIRHLPSGKAHRIMACKNEREGVARIKVGTTSSNFFRRSAFDSFGEWNISWASAQENELMNRWASKGAQFCYLSGVQAHYFIRPEGGQISSQSSTLRLENRLRLSLSSHAWHLSQCEDTKLVQLSGGELFNALKRAHRLDDDALIALAVHQLAKAPLALARHPDVQVHFAAAYRLGGMRLVFLLQKISERVRNGLSKDRC
jgi:glycosyltransferase involved in cell wall biosynthesis